MGIERHRQLQKMSLSYASNPLSHSQPNPIHLLAIETLGTDSLAAAVAKKSLVSLPKITSQATSLGAIRVSERTFQYAIAPPQGIAVHSAVLSDADAARGVLRLADDHRTLVELACGVCVEAAVGDAARARSSASSDAALTSGLKKRKREDGDYPSHRDEGYGDDRSSATENETESDAGSEIQSKLKQLVPGLNADSRVVIIVCGGSNITIDMAAEYKKLLNEGWGNE
ncbi:putative L-serine dehydratase [Aspergillus nomiae NRRL 13137]|uniref:Putative L-serine dehydratase n=1 Tax=Aspergillus nomiae NRRL (strain ATCC 15546 / NRRL 13137 / CBS 260.88 / M93) TaxID=1509407 RepID=A0A0L1JG52_ASPN3|nr:putative L-serine dehydratase [Aspergillus nomiae NRRL 13137]KNG90744.1 putative L-serine dehydratase [Aspergillus nomiae NRRL 13137]